MMLNVPIIHLICHAVEMLLKLSLFKVGATDRELKDIDVRHNLSELKRKCEESGMTFSVEAAKLIEALSAIHVDHRLRYTAFEEPPHWLPYNPREMIVIARKLISLSSPSQST